MDPDKEFYLPRGILDAECGRGGGYLESKSGVNPDAREFKPLTRVSALAAAPPGARPYARAQFDNRAFDGRAYDGRSFDGRVLDGRSFDGRVLDGRARPYTRTTFEGVLRHPSGAAVDLLSLAARGANGRPGGRDRAETWHASGLAYAAPRQDASPYDTNAPPGVTAAASALYELAMSVPKPDPRHATVSFDDLAATRACLETEARLAMAARGLSATAVLGGLASTETCGLGAEGDVSLLDVAPSSVAPVEAGAPGRAPAPLRPKAAMFGVLSVTKARGLGNLLGGGNEGRVSPPFGVASLHAAPFPDGAPAAAPPAPLAQHSPRCIASLPQPLGAPPLQAAPLARSARVVRSSPSSDAWSTAEAGPLPPWSSGFCEDAAQWAAVPDAAHWGSPGGGGVGGGGVCVLAAVDGARLYHVWEAAAGSAAADFGVVGVARKHASAPRGKPPPEACAAEPPRASDAAAPREAPGTAVRPERPTSAACCFAVPLWIEASGGYGSESSGSYDQTPGWASPADE